VPAYNASQTETQSYGGRTRQEASVEGDKVAEAFDLVLKPLAYDVVTMSSFAVTAAMSHVVFFVSFLLVDHLLMVVAIATMLRP